jgi:uncharacterized protein (TIGR00290 family)
MKTLLSWSSGKDSAWALHVLRGTGDIEVAGLFTTVNATFDRVAMHAVRRALLEAQAAAAGLPLHVIDIPWPCPNATYEARMAAFVAEQRERGIEAMAFGDLFLADVRAYREEKLRGSGIAPLFPLWGRPTRALAEEMIDAGLKANLTCIDPTKLPESFAGRLFDRALIDELPAGIDPCGENGEFHTCVWAGPMLAHAIPTRPGAVETRDGFIFADLLPAA